MLAIPNTADRRKFGRIAVVAYTEYPWDARVRREAEALAAEGYEVHAISSRPRSGGSSSELGCVRIHEVPLSIRRGGKCRYVFQYGMFFLLSSAILWRLHLRGRFTLVHVHSVPDFQVFCGIPLSLTGTPVLLDLHEAMPELLAARFRLNKEARWVQIAGVLERLSCRFAKHVIAANDGIRRLVVERGTPGAHVTVVYNGWKAEETRANPALLREELGVRHGQILVHAGGINPERDLDTLLTAISLLPVVMDIHLILAGDGDPRYIEYLEQLAHDLRIAERVRFVGRVSHDRAIALMGLSAVGVVTLEANPLTQVAWPSRVVEFASLGKPLVVPNLRLLRELLGDDARYYSPGDAGSLAKELFESLAHPSPPAEAAENTRRIAGRFSWSKTREQFLTTIKRLEASHSS